MGLELRPCLVRQFSRHLESPSYLVELDFSGTVGVEHVEHIHHDLLPRTQGHVGPADSSSGIVVDFILDNYIAHGISSKGGRGDGEVRVDMYYGVVLRTSLGVIDCGVVYSTYECWESSAIVCFNAF